MNKLKTSAFLTMSIIILLISSCVKDDTTTPTTTKDSRDQFEGTWKCTEKGSFTENFNIIINKETGNTVSSRIKNFSNLTYDYSVQIIVNYNDFIINEQQVGGAGGVYTVKGSGQIVGSQISMSYSIYDGITTENFTAICVK